ncbi:hypothetical protein B0T16DRAFT_384842 [Cercophora newfieldiana]|uniref:Uncharacterized protein n=1 Tax=Cercophora newfieldiana TaxID=92897 RepID=A0AA40CYA6_9PEZI|nr:hypothetical protein B0T16DRAFT_384842 [Cercophora newfieldiana]
MRIPSGWAWLAVATVMPSLAAGVVTFEIRSIPNLRSENGTTVNIINIVAGNLGPSVPSVVKVNWVASDIDNLPLTIKLRVFQVADGNVKDIGVQRVNPEVPTVTVTTTDGGGRFTFTGPRTSTTPTGFPFPKRAAISKAVDESFPDVPLSVTPPKSSGPGTVEIGNVNLLLDSSVKGLPLFFEALFSDGSSSLSAAFAALEEKDESPKWTSEFFTNNQPFPADKIRDSNSNSNLTPSESAGSSRGSSGGLATGAIAGIAVGCAVVVLAAIGAFAWFFIRRRNQAKDDDTLDAYRNGRSRTDELMAEKEANAGVDASPHSPYSDDGGQRDSSSLHHVGTGAGAAAAAVAAHHHKKDLSQSTQAAHDAPRSFTPYSDHHDAIARSPSTHAASVVAASSVSHGMPESPNPGRATPHGVQTPYAHLVEEGMTEDEIRRLEDEERALDAAIEQSAVKRT